MVGDPLPETLEGTQAEIRFWAQERSKLHPKSDEWQLIKARVDDLKHLENGMPRPQPNPISAQSSAGLAKVGGARDQQMVSRSAEALT